MKLSAAALTTEMVNFKNNVPFPLWVGEGYVYLHYCRQNTRGRKKKGKVKIFISFMVEKSPHAL